MTAITDKYVQLGGAMGALGAAMGPESPLAGGAFQHYARGSIYWTQANGAHAVVGAIRARWAALRWERGLLGFPIADAQPLTRNRIDFLVQQFQSGKMELNLGSDEVYVEKAATTAQPNYEVPLAAYIAADTNGGRSPAVNAAQVGQWVDEANRVYAAAGVRFVYDGVLTEAAAYQVASQGAHQAMQRGDVEAQRGADADVARQTTLYLTQARRTGEDIYDIPSHRAAQSGAAARARNTMPGTAGFAAIGRATHRTGSAPPR